MIDLNVIDDEIAAIEEDEDTTYETCRILAALYTVSDHLRAKRAREEGTATEFMSAASGVPLPDLLAVMDEHMSALKVVFPKEYQSVIRKMRALSRK